MSRLAARSAVVLSALLLSTATLTFAQQTQTTIKKVPITPTSAASGQEMYNTYCAVCHGKDGKGNGPAAPALKVPVPDLTTLTVRHEGTYPADYVQSVLRFGAEKFPVHGTKDMPIWGPLFSSVSAHDQARVTLRISNVTKYIESLQSK